MGVYPLIVPSRAYDLVKTFTIFFWGNSLSHTDTHILLSRRSLTFTKVELMRKKRHRHNTQPDRTENIAEKINL